MYSFAMPAAALSENKSERAFTADTRGSMQIINITIKTQVENLSLLKRNISSTSEPHTVATINPGRSTMLSLRIIF